MYVWAHIHLDGRTLHNRGFSLEDLKRRDKHTVLAGKETCDRPGGLPLIYCFLDKT